VTRDGRKYVHKRGWGEETVAGGKVGGGGGRLHLRKEVCAEPGSGWAKSGGNGPFREKRALFDRGLTGVGWQMLSCSLSKNCKDWALGGERKGVVSFTT